MLEYWMASNETNRNISNEEIEGALQNPDSAILFVGYPQWLLNLAAGCCILFMLVGIPGNLFTIVALFRTKKLRNATAILIMNLSISDLMFCCFNLPLATSTFWHSSWRYGGLLCRLFPLLRYGLVAESLFTVLTITINRYIMIGHPRLYPKLYKPKYLVPMILITWIIAFGVLIVTWFEKWGRFGLDPAIGSCSILLDPNGRSPKEFLFVVAFLIPCIVIVVCYARIFYIVRKTAFKSGRGAGTNDLDVNHEQQRSTPSRYQEEEEELSSFGCSSPTNLCLNFSSTPMIANCLNRNKDSRVSAESKIEKSSEDRSSWEQEPTKEEEEEDSSKKDVPKIEETKSDDLDINPKSLDSDKVKTEFRNEIDNIPFADEDLDLRETILLNDDSDKFKKSLDLPCTNDRKKLERMESKASFIIEPSMWFQEAASMRKDRSMEIIVSKTNTPEVSRKKVKVFRRESKFRSIGRGKNSDTALRMSNKDKKLLKMILVIFSSFLVCYLPITITKTFRDTVDWRGLNIAGYILIYMTTCINPVIYVVMSSEYRRAYKNVLLCKKS